MSEFGLNLELDVDAAAGSDPAALILAWFDEALTAALAEPRAALTGGGPMPAAPQFIAPASWDPTGAPVRLNGTLTVSGNRPKPFDATALAWLSDQLADEPERVELEFVLFAGSGPGAANAWYPSLYAARSEDSPGWVRLGAYVAEKVFLDPSAQRLWLDLLRSFADRVNPGFGQVEYGFDTYGSTALEWSLPGDVPLEERDPDYTLGQSRRYLRGYSWLTVVPAELVARLGGFEALQRTGAFAEITALANGGAWLLATADYRDYGPEQVAKVFQALAPVLRPGTPVREDDIPGDPPQRLVFQDAATAASAR